MNVLWKRRALRDLERIHAYVSRRSRKGANSVAGQIEATVDLIGMFPRIGRRLKVAPEYRSLPVGKYPYRVYYVIETAGVVVLPIRHTSRRHPKADEI